jgi:hypothetical protein
MYDDDDDGILKRKENLKIVAYLYFKKIACLIIFDNVSHYVKSTRRITDQ